MSYVLVHLYLYPCVYNVFEFLISDYEMQAFQDFAMKFFIISDSLVLDIY